MQSKLGLALGGGGARGMAHVGVLKVFEREDIPIDLIVGTSMGALVGAAYAARPDAVKLEKQIQDFFGSRQIEKPGLKLIEKVNWESRLNSDWVHRLIRLAQKEVFMNLALFRNALLKTHDVQESFKKFIPDINLEETVIPFAVVAVDLVSGQQVVLREGSLVKAVMASCAIPGFMPPVVWDGMVLADGGIITTMPTVAAKEQGADIVVGVDVGASLHQTRKLKDGIDIIGRATEIMSYHLGRRGREKADVLIEPSVGVIPWTRFQDYAMIIHRGEEAAELKLEEIRNRLHPPFSEKIWCWVKRFLKLFQKK